MIDKAIGVIPPRNELNSFSEKITGDFKESKSDFESYLERLKKKDDQALGGSKKRAQDEPRSERKLTTQTEKPKKEEKSEEPKEGVKKKVRNNKLEDEMVLMSMASIENVIKTPDTEENLDNLKTTNFLPTIEIPSVESMDAAAEQAPDMAMDESLSFDPRTTFAMEVPISDEIQVADTVDVMKPEISQNEEVKVEAQPVVENKNNKILDTLNREQLFQKLETMAQVETPVVNETEMTENDLNAAKTTQIKTETPVTHDMTQKLAASLQTEHKQSEGHFDQDDQTASSDKENLAQSASVQPSGHKEFSLRPADAPIAPQSSIHNTQTQDTNVNEILKQAQYLVKQGGGEVTVKMTPEGMGEVHLKVMLENGKMNVEMNSQDKNIQKLIQDNLSDLKSSLAAHQISVEHVTLNNKLTTVESMQKSSDSQNFTDSRQFSGHGESNNSANQFANHSQQNRQQQQQSSHRFNYEMPQAVPLAQSEIKKAVAHRVYQTNKAQSLNAVA